MVNQRNHIVAPRFNIHVVFNQCMDTPIRTTVDYYKVLSEPVWSIQGWLYGSFHYHVVYTTLDKSNSVLLCTCISYIFVFNWSILWNTVFLKFSDGRLDKQNQERQPWRGFAHWFVRPASWFSVRVMPPIGQSLNFLMKDIDVKLFVWNQEMSILHYVEHSAGFITNLRLLAWG